MFLLWHPSLTAINLSYTFPILETSATALWGVTGTVVVLQEDVKEVQVTQSLPHHYMPLSHWLATGTSRAHSSPHRGVILPCNHCSFLSDSSLWWTEWSEWPWPVAVFVAHIPALVCSRSVMRASIITEPLITRTANPSPEKALQFAILQWNKEVQAIFLYRDNVNPASIRNRGYRRKLSIHSCSFLTPIPLPGQRVLLHPGISLWMHHGSFLLASHGIIPHIWKQLASKDPLLGVPYLYYNSLVVVHLLPQQIILLIELVNIRSADPPARIASSGLLREPLLMRFPLPFDVVFVRPLIWVLQPSRLLL